MNENPNVRTLVFDCTDESDLSNVLNILCALEKNNPSIFYKFGPSLINRLVSVYTEGMTEEPIADIHKSDKGLIVAGSLSSITKSQIDFLKDEENTSIVQLSEQEINNIDKTLVIERKTKHINRSLKQDNVILTTEFWLSDKNEYPTLNNRDRVLQYFAEICGKVFSEEDNSCWILLKGSDTALNTLIYGLKVYRYFYCGQIINGVIHCKAEINGRIRSFFIIGGNVGDEKILVEIINHIKEHTID